MGLQEASAPFTQIRLYHLIFAHCLCHSAQAGLLSAGVGRTGGLTAKRQADYNLVYTSAPTVTVPEECSET